MTHFVTIRFHESETSKLAVAASTLDDYTRAGFSATLVHHSNNGINETIIVAGTDNAELAKKAYQNTSSYLRYSARVTLESDGEE